MSNYTILQVNLLPTFVTEQAKAAFLWACDRRDADRQQYKAEAFAREVDHLALVAEPMLRKAADVLAEHPPHLAISQSQFDDLFDFIITRHRHYRAPLGVLSCPLKTGEAS